MINNSLVRLTPMALWVYQLKLLVPLMMLNVRKNFKPF